MKLKNFQVTRWIERLRKYDIDIKHRLRNRHYNADAPDSLSRRTVDWWYIDETNIHENVVDISAPGVVDDNWQSAKFFKE